MSAHEPTDFFGQLVSALVSDRDLALVLNHVYFDESGTHDGSPVMTMAGYLMTAEQSHRFSKDWRKHLDHYGIPFAHMTDCALGFGHYKNMAKELRVEIQKRLIECIKRRTVVGLGVSVDPIYYEATMAGVEAPPSAYGFCVLACLAAVSRWCDKANFNGKIAYFFESGHRHANEASKLMNYIPVATDGRNERYRYLSHSFVDKRAALPMQAADMLAWQYRHFHCRSLQGVNQPLRADFKALVRPQDMGANYTRATIEQFRESLSADRAASKLLTQ